MGEYVSLKNLKLYIFLDSELYCLIYQEAHFPQMASKSSLLRLYLEESLTYGPIFEVKQKVVTQSKISELAIGDL